MGAVRLGAGLRLARAGGLADWEVAGADGADDGVVVGVVGSTTLGDAEGARIEADASAPGGDAALLPHAVSMPSSAAAAIALRKAGRLLTSSGPAATGWLP
jgi:hypothetical protein